MTSKKGEDRDGGLFAQNVRVFLFLKRVRGRRVKALFYKHPLRDPEAKSLMLILVLIHLKAFDKLPTFRFKRLQALSDFMTIIFWFANS